MQDFLTISLDLAHILIAWACKLIREREGERLRSLLNAVVFVDYRAFPYPVVAVVRMRAGRRPHRSQGGGVISLDKVHPRGHFQVAVIVDIPDGWHINTDVPSLDYLIPTEVRKR